MKTEEELKMLLLLYSYVHIPENDTCYACYSDGHNTVYLKDKSPMLKDYSFYNVLPGKGEGSIIFHSPIITKMYEFLIEHHS